jgi:hypothetical protein
MENQILICVSFVIYLAGLLPAFDYGARRHGWTIFLFAWFWPLFLLWDGIAHSYGGDWNETERRSEVNKN